MYLSKPRRLYKVIDFTANPHTEHACSYSGVENFAFNRKKSLVEPQHDCNSASGHRPVPTGFWEDRTHILKETEEQM